MMVWKSAEGPTSAGAPLTPEIICIDDSDDEGDVATSAQALSSSSAAGAAEIPAASPLTAHRMVPLRGEPGNLPHPHHGSNQDAIKNRNGRSSSGSSLSFMAYMRGTTGGVNPFAGASAAAASQLCPGAAGGGGAMGGFNGSEREDLAQLRVLGLSGMGIFSNRTGEPEGDKPSPLGGVGRPPDMPDGPKRPHNGHACPGKADKEGESEYEKRLRADEKGEGVAGTGEVKKERERRPIQATARELEAARDLQAKTGMGIEEGLTALRANNFDPERAVMWYVEASQQGGMEMALVHHASIESERLNDEYRRAEMRKQEELMKEGDVIGSAKFAASTLLAEEDGSRAVHAFLRRYCTRGGGRRGRSRGHEEASIARRRELVVKLLIKEKEAVRFYKAAAHGYMKALAKRLDGAAGGGGEGEEGKENEGGQLPLTCLEHEAMALEDALTKYPEGNVGGVPVQFLKYAALASDFEEDGLEVVGEGGRGGGGGKKKAGNGERAGVAEGKEGKRRTGVVECIEILED